MINLLAAFTLGLLGSMHCIGMCGPLVIAVPSTAQTRVKFVAERLLYNLGRTVTYGILGALVGIVGKNVLLNIQQDASMTLGFIIFLMALIPFGLKSRLEKLSPLNTVYAFVRQKFSALLHKRGTVALFSLGMVNGLLPCGLVYTALLGAVAVADVWYSILFMMAFGISTIPALVVISLTGKIFSVKFRPVLARVIPVFSIALALILILRGMNLGIPFISPKITHEVTQTDTKTEADCCE